MLYSNDDQILEQKLKTYQDQQSKLDLAINSFPPSPKGTANFAVYKMLQQKRKIQEMIKGIAANTTPDIIA